MAVISLSQICLQCMSCDVIFLPLEICFKCDTELREVIASRDNSNYFSIFGICIFVLL